MGALFNFVAENPETGKDNVINFPVSAANPYKVDEKKLGEMIEEHRAELLVFGKSMFIYPEPISFVHDLIKDWDTRPVVMFDMAHVLGLYGAFQAPFVEGADVVTGSTHKTFFGPQRGLVAGNFPKGSPLRKLWLDIKSRAFPGSTSNHHLGTLLGLLMAAYEMNEFKAEYQAQVCRNAKAFARALHDSGIPVEGDATDGFTETHQVLIRVEEFGNGMDIARRLEENNLVTNYQALPDDETFLEPSGVRMGVQEMTRFGMKEEDFGPLAEYIAAVVVQSKEVQEDVKSYRQKFLEMKYCLPTQQAVPHATKILASISPNPVFTEMFVQNLEKICGKT
jgi:glycine/serine hydroxymethyltransferase